MRRGGAGLGTGLSASVLVLALLGCGQQYRPVVSAINPVGPAAQPTKYAVAVSNPGTSSAGLLTMVDFSGDSILATPQILPDPNWLAIFSSGGEAAIINPQNSLSTVPLSAPSTLITSEVVQTALPTNPPANAPTLSAFTFGGQTRILIPEAGRSSVAILSSASPALQQEIALPATPIYVVGVDTTARAYAISNSGPSSQGVVSAIEGSSLSTSATIPVGVNPVYGVETATTASTGPARAFILNKGSGTVSVINVINNALDANSNLGPNSTIAVGQNPVWADLIAATNELVVLNQGDGVHPGSLSIISIPLCNTAAQPTNPACDASNPVDAAGFGAVIATVPVGVNPVEVAALADGSQAYVINDGNPGAGVLPSVSAVNLASATVTATIPAVPICPANPSSSPGCSQTAPAVAANCPDGTTLTCVYGTPNTLAVTNSTPTGKVYVTSGDSNYMTVIETVTDTVDTHINLQGLGVQVRVTAP